MVANDVPSQGEALVRSAMMGDLSTVARLLDDGVSPDYASAQGDSQMTALMWAASEGHVDIAKSLIENKADVNATNKNGFTALIYAFENLPTQNPRPAPPPGFPGEGRKSSKPQVPVTKKITGHSDVAKLLVMNGARIDIVNRYGENAAHMAARKAQDGWIGICAVQGISLEAKAKFTGHTPLHIAAKENHASTVKVLVETGANINATDNLSWTPLLWAAAFGNVDAVRMLLELGADPNRKGKVGSGTGITSALQEGRKSGNPEEISKLLIRNGAI